MDIINKELGLELGTIGVLQLITGVLWGYIINLVMTKIDNEICVDCEWKKIISVLITTFITVNVSYYNNKIIEILFNEIFVDPMMKGSRGTVITAFAIMYSQSLFKSQLKDITNSF